MIQSIERPGLPAKILVTICEDFFSSTEQYSTVSTKSSVCTGCLLTCELKPVFQQNFISKYIQV